MKNNHTMRFDNEIWSDAEIAARQTHRSTTSYIEAATADQIKRDAKEGKIDLSKK